jgi:hypothetical protein
VGVVRVGPNDSLYIVEYPKQLKPPLNTLARWHWPPVFPPTGAQTRDGTPGSDERRGRPPVSLLQVLASRLLSPNPRSPEGQDSKGCIGWYIRSRHQSRPKQVRETTGVFVALVLRWVQLRFTYWFSEQTRLGGANMFVPNLGEVLQKIKFH